MGFLLALVPDLVKNLFGGMSSKMAMYLAGSLILMGGTGYLIYNYMSMEVEVARLESRITEYESVVSSYKISNEALAKNIEHLSSTLNQTKENYKDAISKSKELQEKFNLTRTEMTEAQNVFDKECGRVSRLMQKKASLVVRYANRATSKLSDEFTEATSKTSGDSN